MNVAGEPPVLLNLIGAILFLGLTGLVIWKARLRPFGAGTLIALGLISAALFGIQAASTAEMLSMFQPRVLANVPAYGTALLCWAFLGFSLQFLHAPAAPRGTMRGWVAMLLLPLGCIALDSNPLANLRDVLWSNGTLELRRDVLCWYLLQGVSAACLLTAAIFTLRAHARTRQPMHRNRTRYLYAGWLLLAGGAALTYAGWVLPAFLLYLVCVPLLVTITLVHQLPDLRVALRQGASYAIMAALTAVLFVGAFTTVQRAIQQQSSYNPVLAGAIIALVLALLFNPLLALIRKGVNHMIHGQDYHPAEVVREYSQSTSNILDLELLAAVSTGAIRQVLGLEDARLVVVEPRQDGDRGGYHLRPITSANQPAMDTGSVAFNSPLAGFFLHDHRPLTQYDVDFLPAFRETPKEELDWLTKTGMVAYVPILAHNEWIGLLAVGRKRSGDSFSDADMLLLTALANQTAASLDNAHLVQHLVALNNELQKAYNDLNYANQRLEKLDRTKSDFIQVASHELRTPITLLMGYSDILAGEPGILDNMFLAQTVSGIRTGAARMQEIVASMLDMAKIDSRSLRLSPKPLSLPALVRSVQAGLARSMLDRQIAFDLLELNRLPNVEADVDALHKVFQQLLSNAVKFTPNGGKVNVLQRALPAGESPLEVDSVEVVVQDTGIGIEPELQDLIFTKFYQTGDVNLHSTSKSRFKGSGAGLGLSIVSGIVEAHGGKIWAVSTGYDEVNCPGSEFHVVLPVCQADRPAAAQPESENTP